MAGNPNLWNISFIRNEVKLQVWNLNLDLFPNWRTWDLLQCFMETKSHEVLISTRKVRSVQSLVFALGPVPNHSWLESDYSAMLVQFIHICVVMYTWHSLTVMSVMRYIKLLFAFAQRNKNVGQGLAGITWNVSASNFWHLQRVTRCSCFVQKQRSEVTWSKQVLVCTMKSFPLLVPPLYSVQK